MKKFLVTLVALSLYILFFSYIDDFKIFKEISELIAKKIYLKSIIYFIGFFLSVYSLYILLNMKSKIIQVLSIVLILFSTSVTYTYGVLDNFDIFGGFRYEDALNILQLLNSFVAVETGATYLNLFLKSLFFTILLIVILLVINHYFVLEKFNKKYLIVPFMTFIFIYILIEKTTSNRLSFSPPFKLSALLSYAKLNQLYIGEREEVYISIKDKSTVIEHIVLIVDESIRADKLQINGFDRETTPYLFSIKDKIFNYGISVSGAVCSNYSESILLTGLTPKNLPDKNSYSRRKPTIFSYAQKAKYRTNLIDILINKTNNRHFLMENDFEFIDYSVDISKKYTGEKSYVHDFKSIDELNKIINIEKKSFTYVVKYGSHFPYEDAYPQARKIFTPTLYGSSWSTDDRDKFLNSYYNVIRWTVDDFFKNLVHKLDGTNTLIIYTSDHGQNLMEDLTIKQTHCAKGLAPKGMGTVPLFFLAMNDAVATEIKGIYKKDNINHTSHFNIFGTILSLMGYDKQVINKKYGKTLLDNLEDEERIYTSGDIFGRSKMFINRFDKEK